MLCLCTGVLTLNPNNVAYSFVCVCVRLYFVHLFTLQACSAIYLAAKDFGIQLPTSSTTTNNTSSSLSWWEVFVGPNKTQELMTCCNAIAGLCYYSNEYKKFRQEVHSKQGNDDDKKDHPHQQEEEEDENEITGSASASALSSLSIDMLSAHYGFIKSLVIPKQSSNNTTNSDDDHFHGGPNGGSSFNDPDSFIWDHQKDLILSSL